MKKIILLIMFLMCIFVISCKNNKDTDVDSYPERINKLSSYKLTGNLESTFPSGTKESKVTVYFKAPNYYRVEMLMPNSIEKQIIIKNDDGVFVLIPALNKNFKVSTSWPLTSSYPYLLQSLSKDIIKDKEYTKEVKDNKTIIKLKATLFDDANKITQSIIFDNNTGLPVEVTLYKDIDKVISKFTFEKIETDIIIDDNNFVVDTTMEMLATLYSENLTDYDRILTYPTYAPNGIKLHEEAINKENDSKRILLTYTGDYYLTIFEKFIDPYDSIKSEYTKGDIYVLGDVLFINSNNSFKFYDKGIEYMAASSTIDPYEMMMICESLRVSIDK